MAPCKISLLTAVSLFMSACAANSTEQPEQRNTLTLISREEEHDDSQVTRRRAYALGTSSMPTRRRLRSSKQQYGANETIPSEETGSRRRLDILYGSDEEIVLESESESERRRVKREVRARRIDRREKNPGNHYEQVRKKRPQQTNEQTEEDVSLGRGLIMSIKL